MKRKHWVRIALIAAVALIVVLGATRVAFFFFRPWRVMTGMRTFGPEGGWPKAHLLERFGRGGMRVAFMPFHRGLGMMAPVGLFAFVALIGLVVGGIYLARTFTVVRRPAPPALACPECGQQVLSEWKTCPYCSAALVSESSEDGSST